MAPLNNLGTHQQPSYLPHNEHTTSGPGVGIGIDSFTPRRLDKISTKSAPTVSAQNTFSHSHHTSGNPKIHSNYHPGTVGSHLNHQSTMGTHSGMPGFSNTKLATTQRKNTISAPISSINRQFQSQPRPSVGIPLPQPQHQQHMYQQHSRPTHNPHAQPSCPTLTARPTLAQVPTHPQGAQTNNIIPPHVHRRLEMYVKQTSTYQDGVDMLIQRASSAPEPNFNLQSGYRDIRTNLTKLEENVIDSLHC